MKATGAQRRANHVRKLHSRLAERGHASAKCEGRGGGQLVRGRKGEKIRHHLSLGPNENESPLAVSLSPFLLRCETHSPSSSYERANNVLDSGMRVVVVILWASERERLGARRDRLVTFYALGIKSGPPTAYRSPPSLHPSGSPGIYRTKDQKIAYITLVNAAAWYMGRRRLETSHPP